MLLPWFGAHNFYLGFTTKAVLQMLLCLLTFGFAGIWGFAEGFIIICSATGSKWHRDALGRELRD